MGMVGEGKEEFRKALREVVGNEKGVEGAWEEMKGRIQGILGGGCNRKGEKGRRRGWWDEECVEGKKKVRKKLRRWRKGEGDGDNYREERLKYKKLIEKKKKEENEKWEKEIRHVKTEGQVWEVVKRERKRRKGIDESIRLEEWKEYFRGLLGGVDTKVVKGRRRFEEDDGEKGLSREEVRKAIRNLRDGQAEGGDGIPGEVWKYGGEGLE